MFGRFLFLLLFLPLLSCNNKLELYGDDYVEVPVVYGFIDNGLDSQYIRINKTFRNTESAYETLQIYDSVCFESIKVGIITYPNQQYHALIPVKRPEQTSTRKDWFYLLSNTSGLMQANACELVIENLGTGMVTRSKINIDPPPVLASDMPSSLGYGPVSLKVFPEGQMNYEACLRLRYLEEGQVKQAFAALPNTKKDKNVQLISREMDECLSEILDQIGTTANSRSFMDFTLFISTINLDLQRFRSQQQQALGITQMNPLYTNIPGCIGIFTSRTSLSIRITVLTPTLKDVLRNRLQIES